MGVPRRTDQESKGVYTMTTDLQPVQTNEPQSIMRLVEAALTKPDFDVVKLQALLAMKERWEANEAKKAYVEAMVLFKQNCPLVYKDKENKQYKSRYTSIGNLVNTINESLGLYGLSASWIPAQSEVITVTCRLTHRMGHSEEATMHGPPDVSGQKNALQQIKSTQTYLKIATFEAIVGIASSDGNMDDDGTGKAPHVMDDAVKADFISQIEAIGKAKEAEALWQTIAAECSKCGDVAAYDELKKALAAKVKALKADEGKAL